MLQFERPAVPGDFEAAVREIRRIIERLVNDGRCPTEDDFVAVWNENSTWKIRYFKAQFEKCVWCETWLANHAAPFDHFRPKTRVDELDPMRPGHELTDSPYVRDRSPLYQFKPGYWWLAYAWTNYLLSCERCNTGWKRCFFPIRGGHCRPPSQDKPDESLLLDPFGREDPSAHLRFDEFGQIDAVRGSEYGEPTIQTCGLRRETLRASREPIAQKALTLAQRVVRGLCELDELQDVRSFRTLAEAVIDLEAEGRKERIHAGMVRSIVFHECDIVWEQVEWMAKKFRHDPYDMKTFTS